MAKAIAETDRRRAIQLAYNEQHGITPKTILKKSGNAILSFLSISRKLNAQELDNAYTMADSLPLEDLPELIQQLEGKMKEAAQNLEFETAAELRDKIKKLRQRLLGQRS